MHQQDMYGEEVDYGQEMGNTRLNEQGGDGSNALVSETAMTFLKVTAIYRTFNGLLVSTKTSTRVFTS